MTIRYYIRETLPPQTKFGKRQLYSGTADLPVWTSELHEARDLTEIRQVILAALCNVAEGCERWAETEDGSRVIFGVKYSGKTYGAESEGGAS